MLKRLFKYVRYLRDRRSWKLRDYRNTALVVKLACSGALTPCTRGVKIIPRGPAC